MSSLSFAVVGPRGALGRVGWPLACSLAIHLGLGAIAVLAGSVELPWRQPPHAVWLDLEPMVIPAPPTPAPPTPVTPPRPVRPPVVEPRKIPASAPQVSEQLVAPPAPPLPSPPAREATAPEPPAQAPPSTAAGEGTSTDAQPSRVPQERTGEGAARSAVASRTPDSAPGGPIVRTARPKGGYQVRPVYPESARRAGIQGTTLLRIHIEVDGHVSDVSVQRSAGHQSLDEAAADAVRRWRFEPALNSTGPVSMWAVVPVEFRIGDRD
jgi:protein TonB